MAGLACLGARSATAIFRNLAKEVPSQRSKRRRMEGDVLGFWDAMLYALGMASSMASIETNMLRPLVGLGRRGQGRGQADRGQGGG